MRRKLGGKEEEGGVTEKERGQNCPARFKAQRGRERVRGAKAHTATQSTQRKREDAKHTQKETGPKAHNE